MRQPSASTYPNPTAPDISATPFVRGFLLNSISEFVPKGFVQGPLLPELSVDSTTTVDFAGSLDEGFVIIMGTCVPTHRRGIDVAETLVECLKTGERRLYDELAEYSGRYAIIYGDAQGIKILQDATAMRSVFYAAEGGVVASHALLVEQAIGGSFHKNDMPFRYGFPGNATPYERTKILTANTYYNVTTKRVGRFWPTVQIQHQSPEAAAAEILDRTVIAVKNVAAQRSVKVALTAGLDSRTLLAVMLQSGVPFETYTYGVGPDTLMDRNLAQDLAKMLGIKHTLIKKVQGTPELLSQLDQANYATHHKSTVPSLAAWIKDPSTVAVTANLLEIGRAFYHRAKKTGVREPLTAKTMRELHYRSIPRSGKQAIIDWGRDVYERDAEGYFADFIYASEFPAAADFIDPFDLFYWEHRMSAWHGAAMVERDYYAEAFIPFNARVIFEIMLGIPEKQRQTAEIFYNIIEAVNARLLELPVNPKTWPPHI